MIALCSLCSLWLVAFIHLKIAVMTALSEKTDCTLCNLSRNDQTLN
jgi:hypothetical protein